jgi:hypothetical protein
VRLLVLYVRSRGVPAALAVMVLGSVGLRVLGVDDVRLIVLGSALGVSVAVGGFGGQDVDLDRTGAIAWPLWRVAHFLAVVVVVVGLVLATGLGTFEVVARACVGLAGLGALGVVLLGRHLAWAPPVVWTVCCAVFPRDSPVFTWMVQPVGTAAAMATAGTLGVLGLAGYATFGPRHIAHT